MPRSRPNRHDVGYTHGPLLRTASVVDLSVPLDEHAISMDFATGSCGKSCKMIRYKRDASVKSLRSKASDALHVITLNLASSPRTAISRSLLPLSPNNS